MKERKNKKADNSKKKLEFLFPELCTIYAESYNVEYLARCNDKLEVIETRVTETPHFVTEDVDMVYLGCLTESGQEKAIANLMQHKARLEELIDKGTIFLITGNAIEIFGKYILCNDAAETWKGAGTNKAAAAEAEAYEIPALGIFDFNAERRINALRHNSMFLGEFSIEDNSRNTKENYTVENMDVRADNAELILLGHKSQFSFAYDLAYRNSELRNSESEESKDSCDIANSFAPMMKIIKGTGMNPGTDCEGIRKNNFFATYSLGPFVVQNPYFAKYLLRKLGLNDELCYEEAAIANYESRLEQYKAFLFKQN